jgi:tripartite ATP-independent transporter DctP family solute receptor
MKLRCALVLVLTVCLGLMSSVVRASEPVVLNLSHNLNRDHPVHQSMQFMADRVKALTAGDLSIKIYPNALLGSQKETIELMQTGVLDMAKSNASEMEAFHEAYGAFNVPYLFMDREHYYRAMQGAPGRAVLESSADKGFVGLTFYDAGARSFYANKPIREPADLKGMKIRVQPSPTAVEMIKLMGGSPTPLAYGELYTALQQGVVDGAENNPSALVSDRHGEVSKIYSEDEHTMIPDVLLISTITLGRLSDEHREALYQAARESFIKHKADWAVYTDEAFEEARTRMGVKIVSDVNKPAFEAAVAPIKAKALAHPELAEIVRGVDGLRLDASEVD